MVDDGLPGKPKKNLPRARPNTSGCPAESARDRNKNSAPESGQHPLDDIVLARRDAAGEQQQIGAEARARSARRVCCELVARHRQNLAAHRRRARTCAASEYTFELRI